MLKANRWTWFSWSKVSFISIFQNAIISNIKECEYEFRGKNKTNIILSRFIR